MGLLTATDVPQTLTPDALTARAESLVAAALCPGLPSLELMTWEVIYPQRITPRGIGVPLYGVRVLGPSILKRWPITGVSVLEQDGVTRLAEATWDAFSIRLDGLAPEFLALSTVRVKFTTGWASPDDVPEAIRQAVALTVQGLAANPLGLKSERLGDVQNVYGDVTATGGLSQVALNLLSPWRYPGV